ncbi:MAG: substrate-binding domain-containing protein [Candidatus Omnitrophota bacterium]
MADSKFYTLVIPRFEDVFHSFFASEVIKGVTAAASRLKADILIHITERHKHMDWVNSESFRAGYVKGVIFADIDGDKKQLLEFMKTGIPYIVMNNYFSEDINCIAIDNRKAAMDVVEYLVKLGHTKIACVAGDLNTQAGEARLEGYKQAMAKYGLSVPRTYIQEGFFLRTPARAAARSLLNLEDRPSAVFAASDVMALEVIDEARSEGIRIPWDLSLVGFDDNPIAGYSQVRLTTVSQPIVEMGRLALEKLNQIVLERERQPVKVVLPAKLVKRESTLVLNKQ